MVKQPGGRVYSRQGEIQPESAIWRRGELVADAARPRKLGLSSRGYGFQS
jgi:hypothetical protein